MKVNVLGCEQYPEIFSKIIIREIISEVPKISVYVPLSVMYSPKHKKFLSYKLHQFYLARRAMRSVCSGHTCFALVSFLTYSSTLKMEAIYSSVTSVGFQRTTLRYISKYIILHKHCCENLKSYITTKFNSILPNP
jgi:hypothetical protein